MGAGLSSEEQVILAPRFTPISLVGDEYCFNHAVTLSLQKIRRAKHKRAIFWFGSQQRILVRDHRGMVVLKLHHSMWTFTSHAKLLTPDKKTVLSLSKRVGLVPSWKIRVGGAKRGQDVIWVQRQVFAIRPVVKVSLSPRYKPKAAATGPDFVVNADVVTRNLVVRSADGSRQCAIAQLVYGGSVDGYDALVRVAAGVDIALLVGILLAADALLYGGLQ